MKSQWDVNWIIFLWENEKFPPAKLNTNFFLSARAWKHFAADFGENDKLKIVCAIHNTQNKQHYTMLITNCTMLFLPFALRNAICDCVGNLTRKQNHNIEPWAHMSLTSRTGHKAIILISSEFPNRFIWCYSLTM